MKERRVYPLDGRYLTEEQIAVVFAMTSRNPEPFDEIARQVSDQTAASFHERWVTGYGHASVAEHAVAHIAVENISRLTCDSLESNRLASYTEKSSRYQVMPEDSFHTPAELKQYPSLEKEYRTACRALFSAYRQILAQCLERLPRLHPQRAAETAPGYRLRLRRIATDACRAVLPAATLTNVGVTANARTLEHAISKLMSAPLQEERELGKELREQGRAVTPTLIKYAGQNQYLEQIQQRGTTPPLPMKSNPTTGVQARLVHWDDQSEQKLTAALLYSSEGDSYQAAWDRATGMNPEQRQQVIDQTLSGLDRHDTPPRELETVDYTFEFIMDYGACREFRRHRMQTCLSQPLTINHGFRVPSVITETGNHKLISDAVDTAEQAFSTIYQVSPAVAQYAVTHAHYQKLLSKMNLRECYHLFQLRTSPNAHESISEPVTQAMRLVKEKHPSLFQYLQLKK